MQSGAQRFEIEISISLLCNGARAGVYCSEILELFSGYAMKGVISRAQKREMVQRLKIECEPAGLFMGLIRSAFA